MSNVAKDDKACDKVAKLPLVSNFFLDKKTGKYELVLETIFLHLVDKLSQ